MRGSMVRYTKSGITWKKGEILLFHTLTKTHSVSTHRIESKCQSVSRGGETLSFPGVKPDGSSCDASGKTAKNQGFAHLGVR